MAANEGPLSEFAAYRLATLDVPFDTARFPIQLSEVDLEDADLVIALKETEHHAMMVAQFPAWASRIKYWQIGDMDCTTADQSLAISDGFEQAAFPGRVFLSLPVWQEACHESLARAVPIVCQ